MQDYGEVICCVGSSFNSANPAIFIQADIRRVQVLQNQFIWLLLHCYGYAYKNYYFKQIIHTTWKFDVP